MNTTLKEIEKIYTIGISERMHLIGKVDHEQMKKDLHEFLKTYAVKYASWTMVNHIYNKCLLNYEESQIIAEYRGDKNSLQF